MSEITLQKIKSEFIRFKDRNREDNSGRPSDFNKRLQEIYVYYFQHGMSNSHTMRHKLWHKYADKE
jgi:hypothetical protein